MPEWRALRGTAAKRTSFMAKAVSGLERDRPAIHLIDTEADALAGLALKIEHSAALASSALPRVPQILWPDRKGHRRRLRIIRVTRSD